MFHDGKGVIQFLCLSVRELWLFGGGSTNSMRLRQDKVTVLTKPCSLADWKQLLLLLYADSAALGAVQATTNNCSGSGHVAVGYGLLNVSCYLLVIAFHLCMIGI